MWQEVEQTYLPWRDHGDLPHVGEGGRWQLQRHIYFDPFYYIDYTLANCCALQFWKRSQNDFESTFDAYEQLCRRGGQLSFRKLAESAGLNSPFEEGELAACVAVAKEFLASQ